MNALLTAAIAATSGAGLAGATGWRLTASRLRRRTIALEAECEAERDRAAAAERDGLTGLWRRDAFQAFAPAALADGNAIALLDLDRFKPINDTYGHAAGDAVLRTIAARLTAELGEEALLARLGGDEFALIGRLAFPAVHAQLEHLTEVLTAPIPVPIAGGEVELVVGVSLGVAWLCDLPTFDQPGDSVDGVDGAEGGLDTFWAELLSEGLAAADAAMYAAKACRTDWRLYDRDLDPVRPAAAINRIPTQRYREHGPTALRDTAVPGNTAAQGALR
jgi:diguanylate cyclase (GGDEF)-like protein